MTTATVLIFAGLFLAAVGNYCLEQIDQARNTDRED